MRKEYYVIRESSESGKKIVSSRYQIPKLYANLANANNAIAQLKARIKRYTKWYTPEQAASLYKTYTPEKVVLYGNGAISSREL